MYQIYLKALYADRSPPPTSTAAPQPPTPSPPKTSIPPPIHQDLFTRVLLNRTPIAGAYRNNRNNASPPPQKPTPKDPNPLTPHTQFWNQHVEPGKPIAHWDMLLSELRWLQTDFREERKWKLATAQLVAQACRDYLATKRNRPLPPISPTPIAPSPALVPETEQDISTTVVKLTPNPTRNHKRRSKWKKEARLKTRQEVEIERLWPFVREIVRVMGGNRFLRDGDDDGESFGEMRN